MRPPEPRDRAGRRSGAVAAIDCGTNSTRLLVADDRGRPIDRRMKITRLGAGVDSTGRLDPSAIARTASVLREYRQAAVALGVGRARLVATSAVRDSSNRQEFLSAAEKATGVRPELLSGMEEGRLSFTGATAELDGLAGLCLVADIGGGSTELIVGEPGSRPDGVIGVESLDVGCVRVTERFLQHDPPLDTELAAARSALQAMFGEAERCLPEMRVASTLIGLAGTVSALASIEAGLDHYDRDRVHHSVLDRDTVSGLLSKLAVDDRAARHQVAGLEPGRADVIVGGALVLEALMKHLSLPSCLVSESDILDGLVIGLVNSGTKAVR